MTETKVVEIVLLDDSNYEKSLRLDDPKDGLTLAEVRAAFADAISEGWLYGKVSKVTSVARATLSVTEKTALT